MRMVITRTKYEIIRNKEGMPVQWDVAFEIEHENGIQQYAPTTIYRHEVNDPVTEASVMYKAAQSVIPGQISMVYKDIEKDYMDTLAEKLTHENLRKERLAKQTEKNEKESEEAAKIVHENPVTKAKDDD